MSFDRLYRHLRPLSIVHIDGAVVYRVLEDNIFFFFLENLCVLCALRYIHNAKNYSHFIAFKVFH